jgi:hypothetical protein
MGKSLNLTELLKSANRIQKQVEEVMRKEKRSVQRRLEGVFNDILGSGDSNYIASAVRFVETLERSVESGVLRRRMNGLAKYLEHGENYREAKNKESQETGVMKMGAQAVEYLKQREVAAGNELISDGGYYQRIISAEANGILKFKKVSERSRFVKTSDLDKLSGVASMSQKGEAKELYWNLRNKGMEREEIIESGKIRVPRGKNKAKYFGGMEGAYQRYS